MTVLTTFQVQLHSPTDTGNSFKERENDDMDDFRAACRIFLPVVYGSV